MRRLFITCLYCKKELFGRTDKKFCDPQCKSAYQYKKSKELPERFYNKVDNQLKLNRKILKKYNKGGMVTVRASMLTQEGFDPNFFTHYWKNTKGDVYLFAYEYGFFRKKERNLDKYVLIKWQNYMGF
ncbi:hypothetical protein [Winogradskyella thalassocola]|uniref:DUF2116 family Zn-ribbon domain-containing protein n=1 Tax=Winogradskyella thalassocola TaxID=262004 RepID=A0A1G8FIC2_9FLAO|nr:hypothetical protein [Winogradskyella thalassocola]SDH81900.1 hypothetical protein SAMN04489796_104263 [Winogradskyella thalassocola]